MSEEVKKISTIPERSISDYIIKDSTRFYEFNKYPESRCSLVKNKKLSAYTSTRLHVTEQKIEEVTNIDTNFWRIITKLRWRDKSEIICNKRTLKVLTYIELYFLKEHICSYVRELRRVIEPLGLFNDQHFQHSEIRILNFLYHIVAKGTEFYNGCIIEPAFCQYILGCMEMQPLYTYLSCYY